MIVIRYAGRVFAAKEPCPTGIPVVACRADGTATNRACPADEESARRWLCDNGLRKSKAKQLLAAALRSEGPYADPGHRHRVKTDS